MTETLSITGTGYKKILGNNDQVLHQKPNGNFCSSRAYNISETKTITSIRAREKGQERDEELGRVEIREREVYIMGEVLERWEEEEGKGYIGAKGEELEGESP